jgi:aryl-alcohol dehydrogenase-like predicted oxidoreductase
MRTHWRRFLPYRPLCNGLLTGKYRLGAPLPAGTRIGDMRAEHQARIVSADSMAVVEKLAAYARDQGCSLLQLALKWLLSHKAIPSVIAGARTPSQVAANVAAADGKLTAANLVEIEHLLQAPD